MNHRINRIALDINLFCCHSNKMIVIVFACNNNDIHENEIKLRTMLCSVKSRRRFVYVKCHAITSWVNWLSEGFMCNCQWNITTNWTLFTFCCRTLCGKFFGEKWVEIDFAQKRYNFLWFLSKLRLHYGMLWKSNSQKSNSKIIVFLITS